jgi:hypothetical protein
MEEVVAFLSGNLEVHKAETFSREDRLLTFIADDRCPGFHGLPLGLCVAFLFSGRTASRRFLVRDRISAHETSRPGARHLEDTTGNSPLRSTRRIMAPAKIETIGPYLRYRKWKRKGDNG